tara:strand:- start:48109 stop:48309 length:201 start_codon:yes stop_codon:yes gene_type:complete
MKLNILNKKQTANEPFIDTVKVKYYNCPKCKKKTAEYINKVNDGANLKLFCLSCSGVSYIDNIIKK